VFCSFSGYVINQAVAKAWVTSTTAAIKSVNSAAKVSVSQIYINDAYHAVGVSNLDYKGMSLRRVPFNSANGRPRRHWR
jgi:hypothetical protein